LGTVIEQDQPLDYYQLHYPIDRPVLYFITWRKIIFLGLNHMYSTYWFLSILLLFFCSLIICTFSTQLPILKYSKQWIFLYNKQSLDKKSIQYSTSASSFINFIYILNIQNYFIFHKGPGLYAYKGLLGKIAPIFVHFSIIISFLGFIFRMTNGWVVQEMIPCGELFHLQNVIASGHSSIITSKFVGKVNDFFITFNNDQSIKQFFSNISLLNSQGKVLMHSYICVNHPLKFKGMTIYQTDWQINALRLSIGNKTCLVKSLRKIQLKDQVNRSAWSCNLALHNQQQIAIIISNLDNDLLIYDIQGQFIANATYGQWTIVYGVPVLFKDLLVSTGLQIKTDPGLVISYFGFLILIISIFVSYISYSQIWANYNEGMIQFSGNTSRDLILYENEMSRIYKKYISLS
jgi:cytochrome c biogenesis protein